MTELQIEQRIENIEGNLRFKAFGLAFNRANVSTIELLSTATVKTLELLTDGNGCSVSSLLIGFGFCLFFRFAITIFIAILSYPITLIPIFLFVYGIMFFKELSNELIKPKSIRVWDYFLSGYKSRLKVVDGNTESFATRITALYQDSEGINVLPIVLAAKLLNIYEKEQRRLIQIRVKLSENSRLGFELQSLLKTLKEQHGEISEEGEAQLRRLFNERDYLLAIEHPLQQSAARLEASVLFAENQRDLREIRRTVQNKIQQEITTSPEYYGANASDIQRELEVKIVAEIKAYQEFEAKLSREAKV